MLLSSNTIPYSGISKQHSWIAWMSYTGMYLPLSLYLSVSTTIKPFCIHPFIFHQEAGWPSLYIQRNPHWYHLQRTPSQITILPHTFYELRFFSVQFLLAYTMPPTQTYLFCQWLSKHALEQEADAIISWNHVIV